jgi:L-rhamnose mutarotase
MKGQDLFAYIEVDDFPAFLKRMAANPESDRWEAHMAGIMERGILPETGFHEKLVEVFHLD